MRAPLPRVALFALLLAVPSTGRADDYSDFRVPDYKLVSWNLNLSGSLDASRTGPVGGRELHSSDGSYLFQAPFRDDDVTDRRERSLFLWLGNRAVTNRWEYTGGGPSLPDEDQTLRTFRDYLGAVDWFESRYPDGGGLAWNYGASARASLVDWVDSRYVRSGDALNGGASSNEYHRSQYDNRGSASLGLGLGRVRDVSGVYEAQVLEARLLETGRLLRPLTAAERQRLAEVFYLSDGIGTVHDRPSKFLWTEVERVLAADGALEEGSLDAWSALRALEPVMLLAGTNRRTGRFVGSFGFVSAERGHTDEESRQEQAVWVNGVIVGYNLSESSLHTPTESDDAGVGVEWSEHHPLSMRSQMDLSTRLTWSSHETLTAQVIGEARYLIADRWDASLTGTYDARAWSAGEARSEPDWFVRGSAAIAYLLEDSWALQLSYDLQQRQIRQEDLPNYFQHYTTLTLGVTYRAVGRLSAPIAGLASRPMIGGR